MRVTVVHSLLIFFVLKFSAGKSFLKLTDTCQTHREFFAVFFHVCFLMFFAPKVCGSIFSFN